MDLNDWILVLAMIDTYIKYMRDLAGTALIVQKAEEFREKWMTYHIEFRPKTLTEGEDHDPT